MASEHTFDIVSKIDLQEMNNAIVQAEREIASRFDFKGSKSEIKLDDAVLTVISEDEYKLKSVIDILQSKMVKRGISIKSLDYGKIQAAAGAMVRQEIRLIQGIDQEYAKKIHLLIKGSKLKVKSQTQADEIRVSGKSRDDLQKTMQLIRDADFAIDLQFTNFR